MKKLEKLDELGKFLDCGVRCHISDTAPSVIFASSCSPHDLLDCVDDCVNTGATVAEIISVIVNTFLLGSKDMNVKVLKVTQTGKGFHIVHVQCGNLFGNCIASPDVTEPGEYFLKSSLREKDGRLVPMIRVEKAG